MRKKKVTKAVISLCLLALLIFIMIPVLWAIVLAFDRTVLDVLPNPPTVFPKEPSLFNFQYALELIPLWRYYGNTILVTVCNTALSVICALMCGYAFSKGRFLLKRFWFLFMLIVMMIPFESRMIPLFLQYRSWGMLNTYWPLILGGFAYVYGIYFARQFISDIPDSLREAAVIDGAGEWRIFVKIIAPLCGPLIATLCILQVLNNWNSYLWPLIVISSREKHLIPVGVSMFNSAQQAIYYGPRMAVALLSALPLILIFLFFQKYIVESIAVSGIKQ